MKLLNQLIYLFVLLLFTTSVYASNLEGLKYFFYFIGVMMLLSSLYIFLAKKSSPKYFLVSWGIGIFSVPLMGTLLLIIMSLGWAIFLIGWIIGRVISFTVIKDSDCLDIYAKHNNNK